MDDALALLRAAHAAGAKTVVATPHVSPRYPTTPEQIVAAANTQAESITSSSHAEQERQVASLRAEVDRLIKRRDA